MPHSIDELIAIMARLRDPQLGCPWDRKQTFATIAPYTIEEAYEVADAIDREDIRELREELGDLLFQVVFYARMAEEVHKFTFSDVVTEICDKMIRRHPHVFSGAEYTSDQELRQAWEQHKHHERQNKRKQNATSVLDGVARALPALMRAQKLQQRAARVGFDWPDIKGVIEKCREEIEELENELKGPHITEAVREEIGDLLFSWVNLARHVHVDAEQALRAANDKFERRFRSVEAALALDERRVEEVDLDTLDRLWEEIKKREDADRN